MTNPLPSRQPLQLGNSVATRPEWPGVMERLYDDEPPQIPAIFLASNLAPIGARQLTRKMAEIFELKKIYRN